MHAGVLQGIAIMSVTGIYMVLFAAAVTTAANLLLRLGIDNSGGLLAKDLYGALAGYGKLLLNPLFFLGFFSYLLASLVWFRVIASEPLSLAYPILVGTTFLLVTLCAVIILKEPLTAQKLLGLLLIVGGILSVSAQTGGG